MVWGWPMTDADDRVYHRQDDETYHSTIDCDAFELAGAAVVSDPRRDADDTGGQPCPECVDRLSPAWRRRGVLAAGVAGLAAILGSTPLSHDEATLNADAELRSVDVDAESTLIYGIHIDVKNHELEPIDPLVIPWGRSQGSQLPWPTEVEGDAIPPGETRTVHAVLEDDARLDVGLATGYRNVARIFDTGTEARTRVFFTEHNPHGPDSPDAEHLQTD